MSETKDYAAISIEVRHVSYNAGMDVDDKAALETGADAILELESELARLREAIEKAPHGHTCNLSKPWETAKGRPPCNCWKRAALNPEKEVK